MYTHNVFDHCYIFQNFQNYIRLEIYAFFSYTKCKHVLLYEMPTMFIVWVATCFYCMGSQMFIV